MATIKRNTNFIIAQTRREDEEFGDPILLCKRRDGNFTDGHSLYFTSHLRDDNFAKIIKQEQHITDIAKHFSVSADELKTAVPELYNEMEQWCKSNIVHNLKSDERSLAFNIITINEEIEKLVNDPALNLDRTMQHMISFYEPDASRDVEDYVAKRQALQPDYNVDILLVELTAHVLADPEMMEVTNDAVDKFRYKNFDVRYDIDFPDGIDFDEKGNPNFMVIPNERMEQDIINQTEFAGRDDIIVYDMCLVQNIEKHRFELGYMTLAYRDENGDLSDPFYPEKDVHLIFNKNEQEAFNDAIDEMSKDEIEINEER